MTDLEQLRLARQKKIDKNKKIMNGLLEKSTMLELAKQAGCDRYVFYDIKRTGVLTETKYNQVKSLSDEFQMTPRIDYHKEKKLVLSQDPICANNQKIMDNIYSRYIIKEVLDKTGVSSTDLVSIRDTGRITQSLVDKMSSISTEFIATNAKHLQTISKYDFDDDEVVDAYNKDHIISPDFAFNFIQTLYDNGMFDVRKRNRESDGCFER